MSVRYALRCDRCGRLTLETASCTAKVEELRLRLKELGWSRRARLKLTGTSFSKKLTDDLCRWLHGEGGPPWNNAVSIRPSPHPSTATACRSIAARCALTCASRSTLTTTESAQSANLGLRKIIAGGRMPSGSLAKTEES